MPPKPLPKSRAARERHLIRTYMRDIEAGREIEERLIGEARQHGQKIAFQAMKINPYSGKASLHVGLQAIKQITEMREPYWVKVAALETVGEHSEVPKKHVFGVIGKLMAELYEKYDK